MAYNRKLLYTKSFPSWDTPEGNLGSLIQNGSPITPIQLVATELNEPGSTITYSVTTGVLPTGLTLSSSGEISGTLNGYSASETVNFTITATDDEGEAVTRDFSLNVLVDVQAQYMVVAGGGGAGWDVGGGGGGGGLLYGNIDLKVDGVYSIVVGGGGSSVTTSGVLTGNGGNSSFSGPNISTITAIGGGGGGNYPNNSTLSPGRSGGSGGGGGSVGYPGGAGTSGQGNNGGSSSSSAYGSGAGGGYSSAGSNGIAGQAVAGGLGYSNTFRTGSTETYSGGGYGNQDGGTVRPTGQNYGGSTLGTYGFGANGTGAPNGNPYSGNSGVVILKIPTNRYTGVHTGSPGVSTNGSDTVLTYTGSGTYTA